MADGRFYQELMNRIEATIGEARAHSRLASSAERLEQAVKAIDAATKVINTVKANGDKEKALANATLYLDALGQVVVGWLWLRQGLKALKGLESSDGQDDAFYEGKLRACEYFSRYELPGVVNVAELLEAVDETALSMVEDAF